MANTKITNHIVDKTFITGQTAVTAADGDYLLVSDASDSGALKKVLASDLIQTSEEVQDLIGAMFSSNTETGIAATYQDGDGTIDLVIGDDTIVSSMLDTNIDIAGTFDVTGATTLDAALTVDTTTLVVDATNNRVGIGTTTPSQILNVEATSTPVIEISTLDDNNPASASALDLVEKQPTHAANTATFGQTGVYGYRIQLNGSDNSLRIKSGSQTTVTDRITLERDTGNVGIGTTSPSYDLDILDTTTASNTNAGINISHATQPQLRFVQTTGNFRMYLGIRTNDLVIANDNGDEKVRFEQNGNVGIGCVPEHELDVVGTLRMQQSGSDLFSTIRGPLNRDLRIDINANGDGDGLKVRDLRDNSVRFVVEAGGNVGIGTASPSAPVHIQTENSETNDSVTGLMITTLSTGTTTTNFGGAIQFQAERNNGVNQNTGLIACQADVNSGSDISSGLRFSTGTAGVLSEKMRLTYDGNLLLGGTTDIDSSHIAIHHATGKNGISFQAPNTSAHMALQFYNSSGGRIGYIQYSNTATTFSTSSDYRLKENVVTDWDATTRLKQLKPSRFNFIIDETNTLVDGFLAHEVSSIVPEAVTGVKDAVDSDGNPLYQGIDQSKLVPLLTKAIQEQQEQIEQLKTEIEALKS